MANLQEDYSYSTGVSIDPEAIIHQLRDTLKRYKSEDIIREIIQNADDAEARQLFFFLLQEGERSGIHPLLRHPAILIFNDGPLKEDDVKGITRLIGGTKKEDTTKIGRFGLGLKSLFHICESFFFAPYKPEDSTLKGKLFDPWIDIRNTRRFEQRLPHWNNDQVNNALNFIHKSLESIFNDKFKNCFFIYIPLRNIDFDSNFIKIREEYFTQESFKDKILDNIINGIVLSLSQCTSLEKIEICSSTSLFSLDNLKPIYRADIKRKNALRRPNRQDSDFKEIFSSSINIIKKDTNEHWDCLGISRFDPKNSITELQNKNDWPKVGLEEIPEKALPHAAITVLHKKNPSPLSLRWACFLPLDDHMSTPTSHSEETKLGSHLRYTIADSSINETWEVLLHGYFFLSSDRKNIFGITEEGNQSIEATWNTTLAQRILFPLLPEVIKQLIDQNPQYESIISAISRWEGFQRFYEALTSKCLVKLALDNHWELHEEAVYMIPEKFPPQLKAWMLEEKQTFALLNKGIYHKQKHVHDWDEKIFSNLCSSLPSAPGAITLSDVDWITTFIKSIDFQKNHRRCLKLWFQRLLKNKFFSDKISKNIDSSTKNQIRNNIYALADTWLQGYVSYVPMQTEAALRDIANDNPSLLEPCLLLPRPDNKQDILSDDQRKELLTFLGKERLHDLARQPEADIVLADHLLQKQPSADLFNLPIYRIKLFSQGTQKEAARSFQALQEQSKKNLLLASEKNLFPDSILEQISLALRSEDVWLSRKEYAFVCTTGKEALFSAIASNELSDNRNIHKQLFDTFIKDEIYEKYKEFHHYIDALKKLIAGNIPIEGKKFVLSLKEEEEEEEEEDLSHYYIFINSQEYSDISETKKTKLNIINENDIRSDRIKHILLSEKPWESWKKLKELCSSYKQIPDGLEEAFREKAWVPSLSEPQGYAPCHIFIKELPSIIQSRLPSSWTTQDRLLGEFRTQLSDLDREWIVDILSKLQSSVHLDTGKKQFIALLQECDFFPPCKFFPPHLQDLVSTVKHLSFLASFMDDSEEGVLLKDLLSLEELSPEILIKFQASSEFDTRSCRYDLILNAASSAGERIRLVMKHYANFVDAVFTHDPLLFTRNYTFPTQKPSVWKHGNQIAATNCNHKPEYLPDKYIWEIYYAHIKNEILLNSAEINKYNIKKYFNTPFCKFEYYRIAWFLLLISGKNESILSLAKEFEEKAYKSFQNIGKKEIKISKINGDNDLDIEQENLRKCTNITIYYPQEKIKTLAGSLFSEKKQIKSFFVELPTLQKKIKRPYEYHDIEYYDIKLYADKEGRCPATSQEEFTALLKESFYQWGECIDIEQDKLDDIWNNHSPTQLSLSSTIKLLKEDLRTILEQLHLENHQLKEQQKLLREEIQSSEKNNKAISQAKDKLWNIAKDTSEIYEAILKKIVDYGYRENGVLFELLQNADDALRDLKHPNDTTVTIALDKRTLSFSHHGRAINDCLDNTNASKNDLYSMLILNRSEKNEHSSTGKLGLGFKSVFLLCDNPEIKSKNLHFVIKNGMFPEENLSEYSIDESTTFIINIKNTIPDNKIEESIFSRFSEAKQLLPVFTHKVRKIITRINGKEQSFSFQPDQKGQGWALDTNAQVLCFSDSDSKIQLALALKNHLPASFPSGTPPLWHTMPTVSGTEWGLGYAMNGLFSLDAGRCNIALVEKDFNDLDKFGHFLGKSLCDHSKFIPKDINKHEYYHKLWQTLSTGLEDSNSDNEKDSLKKKILLRLHANGKGLSYWIEHSNVLGNGVPERWSWPLHANYTTKWKSYTFSSDESKRRFSDMIQIFLDKKYPSTLSYWPVVSSKYGRRLKALGFSVEEIHSEEFFTALFTHIVPQKELSPDLFGCLKKIKNDIPQHLSYPFTVQTQAGSFQDIRQVLLPASLRHKLGDIPGIADEMLRASFAPQEALLDEQYIHDKQDIEMYILLRSGHQVTTETLKIWILNLDDTEQKKLALNYLLEGELRFSLISTLCKSYSGWIRELPTVENLLQNMKEKTVESHEQLIRYLFPDAYYRNNDNTHIENNIAYFCNSWDNFEELVTVWKKNKKNIQKRYLEKTWPAEFRDSQKLKKALENKERESWLMLLLLGYLRSIGRSTPEACRNFASKLYYNYTPIFKEEKKKHDPEWLHPLTAWQDNNIEKNSYAEFMKCFPAFHQLGRFLLQYQNIFFTIMKTNWDGNSLLSLFSPRADDALHGAGKNFDAPPLPLRIGKYWVLRELARLNVNDCQNTASPSFFELCWVPSQDFLNYLNIQYNTEDADSRQKLLVEELRKIKKLDYHFDYWFNIAYFKEKE
ncbi:sacsin N-terminal ATP-binding-like domain-containing protein [Mailhella massiliensis]|uniref:sacsin N-terminal ATP-binding-like domain-containing protein n=1 Tax=Mailhella massiliensis TaxID=1903261 RepID=UPI002355B808|nr:hypothetical protein [Mailhella massiliensis]